LLRPYISRKAHWCLANHEVFQGHYYFDKVPGMEADAINRRDLLHGGGGSGSGLEGNKIAGGEPEGGWELC